VSDRHTPWVALSSTDLSVEIDPLGAQLSVMRDRAGRDLLWHGDASIWAGRAPVLFPIVGSLAGGSYRLGSKLYALSRHGFARGKRFDTAMATPSGAIFKLRADDTTLAVYPFRFELEIAFALAGPALSVTASVRNAGEESMPASLGFIRGSAGPCPTGKRGPPISYGSKRTSPLRCGGSTPADCCRPRLIPRRWNGGA
jgi:galactose mutarotase-like enzyme